MADSKQDGDPNQPPPKKSLQEHELIARLKGSSPQMPAGLTTYVGLLGRSTREGYWILYLTLDMSRYVEVREEDIASAVDLPPDRSPFGSLGGTMLFVRSDATVTTIQTTSTTHPAGEPADEFDLDIRLGRAGPAARPLTVTCPGDTCRTCDTCRGQATCHTCRTQCNQATCHTCQTQCDQATCQTCQTCQTQCNQATCHTCQTQCNQASCHACTHGTCFRTCDIC